MSIRIATLLAAALALPSFAQAAVHSYYIGVDNLPTIASGAYAGLPNPNYNRLTFLLAHPSDASPASSHYHSKAIQVYTGPNLGASTTVITSASNYVPEGSTPPIKLVPGAGIYAGKLVSEAAIDPDEPGFVQSDLTVANTQSLAGFSPTSIETYLFNSSNGRWNAPFDTADVHWELVSVTPGLNVGDDSILNLVLPGGELHLGSGDELFEFTPVLWTDASAAPGVYEATFRLTDESGTFGSSGNVRIVTQVVPEPASLTAIVGALGLLRRRRHG